MSGSPVFSGSNVIPWRPNKQIGGLLPRSTPRLLTCSLEQHEGLRCTNGFFAMVTDDEAVFRRRIVERFGFNASDLLLTGTGSGWQDPIATMLVSELVGDMLATAAADPASDIAYGFEVALDVGFLN